MEYKDKKYTYLGGLVHGISTLATGMKTSIKVLLPPPASPSRNGALLRVIIAICF